MCRECKESYPLERITICEQCLAPLDAEYELGSLTIARTSFESRVKSIWRYSELLPILDKSHCIELGVGLTPLVRASNLGNSIGSSKLYLKNDTLNPTLSFKDRPAEVAVSKALEFGDRVVSCVSTGNLAAAVAAHAAKARLEAYVLAPFDIEPEKISQILAYGAKVISVSGTYDDANRLATLASYELGWNVVNVTSRPYYVEGSKTIAFELCEQFDWNPPDNVIIPVASGALLRAIHRGFEQFRDLDLIDKVPRLFGAQAEGCSPIAAAYKEGVSTLKPVEAPKTIAKSIAIGDPADGRYVLETVRQTSGSVEAVSDSEILAAIVELGRSEGVFVEPAGGVAVAAARKLIHEGIIHRDDTTVCCITGNGLKTPELVLDEPSVGRPVTISPDLEALKEQLKGRSPLLHA